MCCPPPPHRHSLLHFAFVSLALASSGRESPPPPPGVLNGLTDGRPDPLAHSPSTWKAAPASGTVMDRLIPAPMAVAAAAD